MSTAPIPTTLGDRLAAKRKAAGLTQEQLGEGMAADGGDVGKGAVSSWEVNRTQPSSGQLVKLCKRLNCSADDLLGVPVQRSQTKHPHQRAGDLQPGSA